MCEFLYPYLDDQYFCNVKKIKRRVVMKQHLPKQSITQKSAIPFDLRCTNRCDWNILSHFTNKENNPLKCVLYTLSFTG